MNKLLIFTVLALATIANASHFRYYTARWNAMGRQVDWTVNQAWRATFFCGSGNCAACAGQTYVTGAHSHGDGTPNIPQSIQVTSVCCANGDDIMNGNHMFTHTYASDGTYNTLFSSCCRIGGLKNSAGNGYSMESTVTVADGVNQVSAAITLFPIEKVDPNQPYVRDIAASAASIPAGATNVVYSQGTDCGASTQIIGLNVTPAGVLSWNPLDYAPNQIGLYTACLHIDYDLNGPQMVTVDWIFSVEQGAANNNPPVWDDPPSLADGHIIVVDAGDTVTFRMQASDVDVGDTVTVVVSGVPNGAVVSSNPGTPAGYVDFTWVPTVADVGFVNVAFVAEDTQGGFTTSRVIRIEVDAGNPVTCDELTLPSGATSGTHTSPTDCASICHTA